MELSRLLIFLAEGGDTSTSPVSGLAPRRWPASASQRGGAGTLARPGAARILRH